MSSESLLHARAVFISSPSRPLPLSRGFWYWSRLVCCNHCHFREDSGTGRVLFVATTATFARILVLVAAIPPRPLPLSRGFWYWSRLVCCNHCHFREDSGTGRSPPRPLPFSRGFWYWSQRFHLDHYHFRGDSGTGRSDSTSTTTIFAGILVLVEKETEAFEWGMK